MPSHLRDLRNDAGITNLSLNATGIDEFATSRLAELIQGNAALASMVKDTRGWMPLACRIDTGRNIVFDADGEAPRRARGNCRRQDAQKWRREISTICSMA